MIEIKSQAIVQPRSWPYNDTEQKYKRMRVT